MEFKLFIYLIGIIIYFVFRQFKKLQNEALKRKAELEQKINPVTMPVITLKTGDKKIKTEKQIFNKERFRQIKENKQSKKIPVPIPDTREHAKSVVRDDVNATQATPEGNFENIFSGEIDFRKMIIYSEILKRPSW